ncbi:hypothetical protein LLH06_12475 [Mucilaginibacter daejeonensis]|uniref:hypothetical protein n=1 Tax=Mucilaginibacter daejeonensis TaxID=398049 RepID=UPI001D170809|nr:hypothetical protein [Mucilaginibacter daejeonensis]UEG51778.1 hypothetical protein LLH06_12475 [Mucilaginibacter daejeonensis]
MRTTKLLLLYCIVFSIGATASPLDSLRQRLQVVTDDAEKASLYTQIAGCYLNAVSAPNPYTKRINQENAINYSMLAMKLYSKRDDTTGMVRSYRDLSMAYRNQNKRAQSKWFILQANTLARKQRSPENMAATLNDLANVKMDYKDHNLAKRDLREAHRLALKYNLAAQDSLIRSSYSRLYTFIRVAPEENVFQGLDETLKKEELANLEKQKKMAALAKIQGKKKVLAVVNKKRGDEIRIKAPTIYWETPSNRLTNDSIKTVTL